MGDAWNWPLFHLVALRFGDTGHDHEYINFRVGPLICEQGKLYTNEKLMCHRLKNDSRLSWKYRVISEA